MCGVLVTALSACRYELAINGCEAFAIVTIRRRLSNWFGEEGRNRRADLADAMMQDFKRRLVAKLSAVRPLPKRKRQ
jgi:hypothetical protein